MRRLLLLLLTLVAIQIAATQAEAQTPLTPIGNLRGVTDSSGRLIVNCGTGCSGSSVTDDDDGTLAGGAVGSAKNIDLSYLWNGTNWVRMTGDATNGLKVQCASGCSGSTFADNAAFTFGTTVISVSGGVFDDTAPNAATENSAAAARISGNRNLYMQIRDGAAGAERGVSVTAANELLVELGAGTANIGALTAGDADIGNVDLELAGTAVGQTNPVAVRLSDGSAFVTPATDVTEDAAETAGGTGPMVLSVRRDTAASSSGTSGDNSTFNTDANGLLWTRTMDPCSALAKTFHVVNTNTATTVEIANAVASQFFYICSVNLVAAAAQTVAIGEDDTDGCGSITAGLHGGATAATGWSFAANGGIALGDGGSTVMKTGTANRYLCIITGQAVQISGTIAYVSAP